MVTSHGVVTWPKSAVFRNFNSANYFPQSAIPQITNTPYHVYLSIPRMENNTEHRQMWRMKLYVAQAVFTVYIYVLPH